MRRLVSECLSSQVSSKKSRLSWKKGGSDNGEGRSSLPMTELRGECTIPRRA